MKKLLSFLPLFIMLLTSCGKKIEDTKKASSDSHKTGVDGSTSPITEPDTSDKNKEELFNAINNGTKSVVEIALEKFENIDFSFNNGETPLTQSLLHAKTEVIRLILLKTKKPNQKNTDGLTPLHISIYKNNSFIFKKLIKRQVDVNIKSNQNVSPLIFSLHTSQLKKLIPKVLDNLTLNKSQEQIEVTLKQLGNKITFYSKTLLLNGAKLDTYNVYGKSSIQILESLSYNNSLIDKKINFFPKVLKLAKFIRSHKKVSNRKFNDAVKSGELSHVDYLLNNYPKYSEIIKKRNLLITAINLKDKETALEMLTKLLKHGSNPNNEEGIPPLIHASIEGKLFAVEKLSTYGADINLTDDEGLTALDHATLNEDLEMAELLYRKYFSKIESQYEMLSYQFSSLFEDYNLSSSDFGTFLKNIERFSSTAEFSDFIHTKEFKSFTTIINGACKKIIPQRRRFRRPRYTPIQNTLRKALLCYEVSSMPNGT